MKGNSKSHICHLPTCPTYGQVSVKSVVTCRTEEEAVKAGYRKARNCL